MSNSNVLNQTNDNSETTSISITLPKDVVKKIDEVREIFKVGKGISISRSQFVEQSLVSYLGSLEPALNLFQISKQDEEQVIIFTARESIGTYANEFKNGRWDHESLSPERKNDIESGKIKYFALYKTNPSQCIEEFAEIINIEESPRDPRKWRFYLGPVQTLKQPIYIGNAIGRSLSKGRVTTLTKLQTVKTVDQLF